MNDLLIARRLYKVYTDGPRSLHVLKGIDLKVRKGEIVVVLGPSGAGKSTLLHLLGGLDPPTEGEVFLDGTDLYKLSSSERAKLRNQRIGFVFQFYHLLGEFTALENVMLPAMVAQRHRSLEDRAKSILDNVGLSHRIYHRPDQLSGGEQQRVAIARALMNEPDIVFCDEPTGNLDRDTSNLICGLIQNLNRERSQTFVVVSHEEAMAALAEDTYRIKDGRFSS